jgi:cytochrome oxidase assembly protein ShyY1
MTEEDKVYEREWHLDKKVPIALILTILIQTVAAFWFVARLDHRVEALERSETRATATAPVQADRLTRVEVKLESVQEGITEIKRLIQAKP